MLWSANELRWADDPAYHQGHCGYLAIMFSSSSLSHSIIWPFFWMTFWRSLENRSALFLILCFFPAAVSLRLIELNTWNTVVLKWFNWHFLSVHLLAVNFARGSHCTTESTNYPLSGIGTATFTCWLGHPQDQWCLSLTVLKFLWASVFPW